MEELTIADNYRPENSYYGPDFSLAAHFTDGVLPEQISEDEELQIIQTIASIINFARVNALHKFRFMLRYFAKYPPESGRPDEELREDIIKQYGDMYDLFGSRHLDVEQLLLEDWIGYNPGHALWFDGVGSFSEGLAFVVVGNKYGYIDTTGRIVISPQFEFPEGVTDGLASSLPISFSEGLAVVALNGKYGYINRLGRIEINPQFDSAKAFSDGLAWVLINGKYGYIDQRGDVVIQYDRLEFPLRADKYLERIDQSKVPKFPSVFAPSFSEGFAPVELMGEDEYPIYGYIDKTGEAVIEPVFHHGMEFLGRVCTSSYSQKGSYTSTMGIH